MVVNQKDTVTLVTNAIKLTTWSNRYQTWTQYGNFSLVGKIIPLFPSTFTTKFFLENSLDFSSLLESYISEKRSENWLMLINSGIVKIDIHRIIHLYMYMVQLAKQ